MLKTILISLLGIIAGYIAGSIVNMSIILGGLQVIPLPDGVTMETLKEGIADGKFEFRHYIFPFLAHAMHALVAAFVCTKIVTTKHLLLAMIMGTIVLISGIYNSLSLETGMVANLIDWVFAYIPMAWIGYKLAYKGE